MILKQEEALEVLLRWKILKLVEVIPGNTTPAFSIVEQDRAKMLQVLKKVEEGASSLTATEKEFLIKKFVMGPIQELGKDDSSVAQDEKLNPKKIEILTNILNKYGKTTVGERVLPPKSLKKKHHSILAPFNHFLAQIGILSLQPHDQLRPDDEFTLQEGETTQKKIKDLLFYLNNHDLLLPK